VLDEILALEYHLHLPGEDIQGSEKIKGLMYSVRTAFPNLSITIDDEIVSQDKVVFRWTISWTYLSDFFGMPPSSKRIGYTAIDIIRNANGRIFELWNQMDRVGFELQLTQS
jgi:predicted ester cyclase